MYLDTGALEQAAGLYEQLLQRKLDADLMPRVHYGLAWCLLKQDNLAGADSHFARVDTAGGHTNLITDA